MIPSEQATQLFEKYLAVHTTLHCKKGCITIDSIGNDSAIRCALIAVDEIMSVPKQLLYTIYVHRFRTCEETDINTWNEEEPIIIEEFIALDYWQQVKQEIEKL